MSCVSPVPAWRTGSGEIVFAERGDIAQRLDLPCGQCIGCRLQRCQAWALRCMHESQCHAESCFITLTYRDEDCPGVLVYHHFQDFMKRLRKRLGKCRFFMCGEYGDEFSRPHFHACLFGVGFPDRVPWSTSGAGVKLYRSAVLESLWTFGYSSIGEVTFESAAYVASYVLKKRTGVDADSHYARVNSATGEVVELVPEFCHMSLKPGIGADWIKRYRGDVYRGDGAGVVVGGGVSYKPPRYYDKLMVASDPDYMEHLQYLRYLAITPERVADNSADRLRVRENVLRGSMVNRRRTI